MSNNIFDRNLKSGRLLLRRLKISDIEAMYEYTSDPKVTQYLEWPEHTQISLTKSFVINAIEAYEIEKHAFLWAIELISEAKMIGVIRVFDYSPKNKRAEISYILNPAYQGKGYIGEAIDTFLNYCFYDLSIQRIQAKCTIDNVSSEKVMQKAGMQREAIMKKFFYMDDEFKDALLYAVTDTMYQNIQK